MTATDPTDVLDRFEQAWRETPMPDLSRFLPEGEERTQALIDLVHIDMEMRAKAGASFAVEDYARRFPELQGPALIDLVAWEYHLRSKGGAVPALGDYARRFPALAGALGARLGAATEAVRYPVLAGYVIDEVVGRGGMGVVYRGRHLGLDRPVAVKVIRAGLAAHPQARRRFEAEGRAVARLDHPGIVRVFDSGTVQGQPYLVMEYVSGGSLASALRGPLPPRLAIEIVLRLADAVQHAHERGVIHRDLKPANVLMASRGQPQESETALPLRLEHWTLKIADFGLARLGEAGNNTSSGEFLGTAAYAAPEQVAGEKQRVVPATDVYSLGAILYELLTGRPPFQGTAATILAQSLTKPAVAPGIAGLDGIVLKALAKAPEARYASARELAQALESYLRTAPPDTEVAPMPALSPPAPTRPAQPPSNETLPGGTRPPKGRVWVAAAILGLGVLALGGIAFVARTASPTVTVSVDVDTRDANNTFELDGKQIEGADLERPVRLAKGKHQLVVKKGGRAWKRFEVTVGDEKQASVKLLATVGDKAAAHDKEKDKDRVKAKPDAARERKAAEALIRLGATLGLVKADSTYADCSRVEDLPAGDFVILSANIGNSKSAKGPAVRDALAGLSRLEQLGFFNCPALGDEWAAAVKDIPSMHSVSLGKNASMTEKVFKDLAASRIRQLSVSSPPTANWLHEIGRITSLTKLNVTQMPFDDLDLEHLAGLTGLTWLELNTSKGGAVTGEGLAHLKKLTKLELFALTGAALDDAELRHLEAFAALKVLTLDHCRVTGKGFASLAKLPHLTRLQLNQTRLGDPGLARLADCPALTDLTLEGAEANEAGLAGLARSKTLLRVYLNNAKVSEKGVVALAGLRSLLSIELRRTRAGDDAAIALSKNATLESVTLGATSVTDNGVRALAGARRLESLDLSATAVSDDGARALAAAPRLRELRLDRTALTDEGLKALGEAARLRKLNVSDTKVTRAGVEAFKKARPGCEVIANPAK